MCKKCDELINVPKNRKKTIKISEYNSFDTEYHESIIQKNHDEKGNEFCFIKSELMIKSTGRTYNDIMYIKYCPFCGEKIVK